MGARRCSSSSLSKSVSRTRAASCSRSSYSAPCNRALQEQFGDIMADNFDVIVIGGGPAGYPAAIRAAQNKLSVACIDEWKNLDGTPAFGGTCLNAGCIPSKALLESSELYHKASHEFKAHGIGTGTLSLDVAAMQKRKAG